MTRTWPWVLLFLIFLFIWHLRLQSGRLELQENQQINISTTIRSEPSTKSYYQLVWLPVGSQIIGVQAPLYPRINYGDFLVASGRLSQLEDSSRWLLKTDQFELNPSSQQPHSLLNFLSQFRQQVLHFFQTSLPQDQSALLGGMVLGSKSGISDDFYQALQSTGTLHVVVASGMNVMLVAGAIASIFTRFLRRQTAMILALISIWLYVFLAGLDAPLIRAGLMGSLSFIGLIFGRIRQAGRLLTISSLIMLVWRPIWAFDVGFQLSVAATAGLIWLSPLLQPSKASSVIARIPPLFEKVAGDAAIPWEKHPRSRMGFFAPLRMTGDIFHRLTRFPLLGDSLVTTLAAQIAVWPILIYHFGNFSIISPLINALVLWIVAPATQLGMLIGIISIPLNTLASILIWLVWPLLTYFISLVQIFNQLPIAQVELQHFPIWIIPTYYAILVLIIRRASAHDFKTSPS